MVVGVMSVLDQVHASAVGVKKRLEASAQYIAAVAVAWRRCVGVLNCDWTAAAAAVRVFDSKATRRAIGT
jgi:hypothetical protein